MQAGRMGEGRGGAETWLAALVVQTNEALATIDESGRINWANDAAVSLLSMRRVDVVGASVADLVHPDDLGRAVTALVGVGNGARPRPGLIRLRSGDGSWRLLEISPSSIELDPSALDATSGADVTSAAADPSVTSARRLTMVALRDNLLQEAHWNFLAALSTGASFAECVDSFAVGISNPTDGPLAITFDDGGRRHMAGSVPAILAGIDPDGAQDRRPGTPWADALRTGRPAWCAVDELPADVAAAATTIDAAACVAVPVADPASASALLLIQWPPTDAMTQVLIEALVRRPAQAMALALERRDAIRRLERLAHHDGLSGLANRDRFFTTISEMASEGRRFGICYIDLDLFKAVNDSLGHLVGDAVIEACGRRLERICRPEDLAARLGGDEFAVACPDVDDETLASIAGRVIAALTAPISVDDHVIQIGASVGCAMSVGGVSSRSVDDVVGAADAALYRAKRNGRNQWASELDAT
jgi:diguanylate cyclase (GGDEF)-like protein/PAS domain S-box-containing protein